MFYVSPVARSSLYWLSLVITSHPIWSQDSGVFCSISCWIATGKSAQFGADLPLRISLWTTEELLQNVPQQFRPLWTYPYSFCRLSLWQHNVYGNLSTINLSNSLFFWEIHCCQKAFGSSLSLSPLWIKHAHSAEPSKHVLGGQGRRMSAKLAFSHQLSCIPSQLDMKSFLLLLYKVFCKAFYICSEVHCGIFCTTINM